MSKARKWLSVLVIFFAMPCFAAVLRVDLAASGVDADGSSWQKAYKSLQAALSVAGGGDEIWVAAATYRPAAPGGNRAVSFVLLDGVALHGGFAGNETHREQRDPVLHETILCGDLDGNDELGVISDNSNRVLTLLGASSEANRLDGFTIRGGRADFTPTRNTGAGLYVEDSHIAIANCVFTDNFANNNGGAVHVTSSEVALLNCAFRANGSYGFGAAVFAQPNAAQTVNSNVTIEDCVFQGNDLQYALSANHTSIVLSRCNFMDNTGGALSANDRVIVTAENSVFMRNGGMSGAVYAGSRSEVRLLHCILTESLSTEIYVAPDPYLKTVLAITNSIVWNDSYPPLDVYPQTAANAEIGITCTLITGGYAGENNLDAAPRFRLLDSPGQPNWDSPSIDLCAASSLAEDIEGQPRPQNTAFDAGAYEFGEDTDGGGLPDWYEFPHGLEPDDPEDDAVDTDGDGLNNLEEFRRGTDPQDETSPPSVYFVSKTGSDEEGDGSASWPWRTITFALANMPEGAETFPVTLHVGAGTYDEQVILRPYVHIAGAGAGITVLRHFAIAADDHFVVRAAAGTALSACTVTLPAPVSVTVDLLRVTDTAISVSDCVLDGLNSPRVIGVFITGTASSASTIQDSTIRRVEYGVYAADSGVNITRNLFEDILEGAIFVRAPEVRQGNELETPLLGTSGQLDETGFNRFRMNTGFFVNNTSTSLTMAEYNDWGVYTHSEIESRILNSPGEVDFEPFLGKATVRGMVAVELLESVTWEVIPPDASPAVRLDTATGSFDGASGLHLFTNLAPGTYMCTASATGYTAQTRYVTLAEGQIAAVTFLLQREDTGEQPDSPGCFKASFVDGDSPSGPRRRAGDICLLLAAALGVQAACRLSHARTSAKARQHRVKHPSQQ